MSEQEGEREEGRKNAFIHLGARQRRWYAPTLAVAASTPTEAVFSIAFHSTGNAMETTLRPFDE